MRQSLPPAEIIVLDDGYPDNGVAAVEGLTAERPIKILRNAQRGASSGRNYGVTQAKGDFIALLDQDDIWYPNHLERLAQPFVKPRSRPLGWTYSNVDEIDERGTVVKGLFHSSVSAQHPKLDLTTFIREDAFIFPSASLISRKAFQVVGGFDDNSGKYENDDLFLRIFQAGFDNEYLGDALSQRRSYQRGRSATPSETTGLAQYVRKLQENFKDDPERWKYYGRVMLVPRFLRPMLSEYVKAIRSRDPEQIGKAAENLRVLAIGMRLRQKAMLWLLLSLGTKSQLVTRILFSIAHPFRPMIGRLWKLQ